MVIEVAGRQSAVRDIRRKNRPALCADVFERFPLFVKEQEWLFVRYFTVERPVKVIRITIRKESIKVAVIIVVEERPARNVRPHHHSSPTQFVDVTVSR